MLYQFVHFKNFENCMAFPMSSADKLNKVRHWRVGSGNSGNTGRGRDSKGTDKERYHSVWSVRCILRHRVLGGVFRHTTHHTYYSFNVRYLHAYAGQTFFPWCHTSTSLGPLPSLALAPYPSYPHPTVLSKSFLVCPYLCCPPLPSSYKRSPNHPPPSARYARTTSIYPIS